MNKTRIVSFGILCVVLFVLTSFGMLFFYEAGDGEIFQHNIGADSDTLAVFTNIFIFLVLGLSYLLSETAVSIVTVIALFLFRLAAVRKNSMIQEKEYETSRTVLLCTAVCSAMIQTAVFRFRFWFLVLLYHAVSAAIIYLLYLTELSEQMQTKQQETEISLPKRKKIYRNTDNSDYYDL